MIKPVRSKLIALSLSALLVSMLSACNGGDNGAGNASSTGGEGASANASGASDSKSGKQELPLLTYSVFTDTQTLPTWVSDQDDVVAKYVKDKFNIQVGDVSYLQGMTFKERMNLFIASNELPDVISVFGDSVTVPSTGRYAELGDLIKQYAPEYMKLVPEDYWKDQLYDGKLYSFGAPSLDGADYPDDPYAQPNQTWDAFFTSEKVLSQLGYKFTPLAEINRQINEMGKKPTADMYKIEPEIKTPEDFYQFLSKIKQTMPKVNGQDVIPFSIPIWLEPHFGATFGLSGWWKYNPETKKVSSFLTDDESKAYWQFMNRLYRDGLLDKDFAIQKEDQLNDKILQGRVKAFMWSSSYASNADVQKALKQADPNDNLRAIPLPKQAGASFVGVDHVGKTGRQFYIRKDFKDIPRLLEFWNWALTEETHDFVQWGPDSLGLWTDTDGKKQWTDEMYDALIKQNDEYLKTNYYGKGLGFGSEALASKTINGRTVPIPGGYSPYSWEHNYKYEVPADDYIKQSSIVSGGGNDSKGYLSTGASDATNKVTDFVYGEFEQQFSAKLFAAKNDAEFDKRWDELLDYFNNKIGFAKAKQEMEDTFRSRGFEVVSD